MNHDYTLVAIIALIIVIQVIVFVKNISKINNYKKTLGNVKSYRIVNVNVQEDRIKDISIDEVFRNRIEEKYANSNIEVTSNSILTAEEFVEDFDDEYADTELYNQELEFPEDEEEYKIDKN